MIGPICVFKDDEQLNEYLKYWKKVLLLDDWIIKAKLVPSKELEEEYGHSQINIITKILYIEIAMYDDDMQNYPDQINKMFKFCQEWTLIHELLHCRYNHFKYDRSKYEMAILDTVEHSTLDSLARTLLMVKYNIQFEWFE